MLLRLMINFWILTGFVGSVTLVVMVFAYMLVMFTEMRKIGQETVQPDNEMTRGKINKIGFMLEVTEVE